MEQPIYNTQESILAAALKLFGSQQPTDDQGKMIVASNTFTKELLRNLRNDEGNPRYAGRGMSAEQCAVDAHKRGITGILIFHFLQSADQQEFCRGWEEMEGLIKKQEEEDKSRGDNPARIVPMGDLNISHEQLGRLFCLFAKQRKELFKLVRQTRPALALMETIVEYIGDRKTRITGSGKIRSLKL